MSEPTITIKLTQEEYELLESELFSLYHYHMNDDSKHHSECGSKALPMIQQRKAEHEYDADNATLAAALQPLEAHCKTVSEVTPKGSILIEIDSLQSGAVSPPWTAAQKQSGEEMLKQIIKDANAIGRNKHTISIIPPTNSK